MDKLQNIKSSATPQPSHAAYETDAAVSQYCEAHYGDAYFGVPNFPRTCARICLQYTQKHPRKKALDLGCALGRASFELAREFEAVTGLDYSARFIRLAEQMRKEGGIRYELVEEGRLVSLHERRLSDLGLGDTAGRVEFHQADATHLAPRFVDFDLVLAANLIDRLADPCRFLSAIHQRINTGGILVLTSPYTWLAEFTPPGKWVGGYLKDSQAYSTLDGLKDLLGKHFRLVDQPRDVEFVLHETRRKFQHTLAQLTVWEKIK